MNDIFKNISSLKDIVLSDINKETYKIETKEAKFCVPQVRKKKMLSEYTIKSLLACLAQHLQQVHENEAVIKGLS